MSREEDGIKALLEERGATHGHFPEVAGVAQHLKQAMRAAAPLHRPYGKRNVWEALPPIIREALEMMAAKMARIVCGNERHDDHWRDIQGYAQLVLDWLERERRQNGRT